MAKKPTDGVLYRHDLDAERAVLGAILLDPQALARVLEQLQPDDFYLESHRKIFRHAVDLHRNGYPVDIIPLLGSLKSAGELEPTGGLAYLNALTDAVPVTANVTTYAQLVSDCAHSRRVLDLARSLGEAATTEGPSDLHRQAMKLAQAAEPRLLRRPDASAKDLIQAFAARYDEPESLSTRPPIPTPWPALTSMLCGGWTGGKRPYYIGARRKVGKTSAAIEIAVDAATRHGVNVVFFELELDMQELLSRMISSYAEVPHHVIERRRMTAREQERYVRALETCYTDRLRIDASRFDTSHGRMERIRGSRTIEGIRRTLNRIRLDQEIGLVVVDHLQRIEPPFPCPIFERVTQASNGLAEIAQEFGVPVVAMLQLNEGKDAPISTDTRGGQEIGNDCQALMLLDRPPMRRAQKEQDNMTDLEKEEAELIVALHGSGATGTIPMRYTGAHMRWYQAGSDWASGKMAL